MTIEKGTALITGASAGIGRAYAEELFLVRGMNLVLVARREQQLDELRTQLQRERPNAKETIRVIKTDLIDRSALKDLLMRLEAEKIDIDLLVNNAGFGSVGSFESKDIRTELDMVELNCKVVLQLCHHFLPKMKQRRSGTIINVASTVSFQPIPFMATYGATKAFVRSLSAALWAEARASNVHVMAHCPGPTKTEFHLVAGLPEKLAFLKAEDPRQTVQDALRAADRRQVVFVNGWSNRCLAYLARLLPDSLSAQIVSAILGKHQLGDRSPR